MALAVTSSTSIAFSSSSSRTEQVVHVSSTKFQPSDVSHLVSPAAFNLSRKRFAAVKALNAEPRRNHPIVPSAATTFAPAKKIESFNTQIDRILSVQEVKAKNKLMEFALRDISGLTGFEYQIAKQAKKDAARQLGYTFDE